MDMLITSGSHYYTVDFKYTDKPPQRNHLYQICGYALMLEEMCSTRVGQGFVYLIPRKDVMVFKLNDDVKRDCRTMVHNILDMIEHERMPAATSRRARCVECEYRNYCRDIW